MDKIVSVFACKTYEQEAVNTEIKNVIDALGGISKFVKSGQNVVLKPNLIGKMASEKAATTHPAVVFAVAKLCLEIGAKVTIADSPGGLYNKSFLTDIYRVTGMAEKFSNTEVKLNDNFSYSSMKEEKTQRCFEIIDVLKNADVIINIPKLKTHSYTGFSGATKNLFGAIPGLLKVEYHGRNPELSDFCNTLVDIERVLSPKVKLHVFDAIVGMEGEGPTAGKPREIGVLMASENSYYLDYCAQNIIKDEPLNSPVIISALKKNIIENFVDIIMVGNATDLTVENYSLQKANKDFLKKYPRFLKAIAFRLLCRRPKILTKQCKGCRKCAEHCPPKAISMHKDKAKIEYSKCIKCFCCQELCPFHVIRVKKPLINGMLRSKK